MNKHIARQMKNGCINGSMKESNGQMDVLMDQQKKQIDTQINRWINNNKINE